MRNNEEEGYEDSIDGSSDVSDEELGDPNQNHDLRLTPLWVASKDGVDSEVKKLLQRQDFDIERGCYGMTPLFTAILFNNPDVVEMLLRAGADDSFIFSKTKYTCLMLAVSMSPEPDDRPYPHDELGQIHRQICVVSHLLDNKKGNTSFVNMMGFEGKRPLDVVERVDIAEMLINAGADVNLSNPYDESTALFGATKEMTKLLLARGANATHKDFYGNDALSCILQSGTDTQFVQMLLDAGVDINGGNKHGITPLHRVGRWGNSVMAKFLLTKAVCFDVKDTSGGTPCNWTKLAGNTETLALFETEILRRGRTAARDERAAKRDMRCAASHEMLGGN